VALRSFGVVALGGGVVSALHTIGWPAPVVLLGSVAMAIVAICWVLNDHERPRRLALLIRAWRGQAPTPRRRGAVKAAPVERDAPPR